MTEKLEKKVKRSYKYRIDDFNPLFFGFKSYMTRTSNDIQFDLERIGLKSTFKYFSRLLRLMVFNGLMIGGCFYLNNYLIKNHILF
jgi:hypothetical protein